MSSPCPQHTQSPWQRQLHGLVCDTSSATASMMLEKLLCAVVFSIKVYLSERSACTAKRPPILFSFENLETNWQQKLVSWYLAGAPGWQDLLSGLAIRWKVFLSWHLLDGRICYRRLAFIYGLMTLMAGFAIGHPPQQTHKHKIPFHSFNLNDFLQKLRKQAWLSRNTLKIVLKVFTWIYPIWHGFH